MKRLTTIIILLTMTLSSFAQTYQMPAEHLAHEGTWLQWPHQYEYGITYRNRLDATWVAMTSALVGSEKVHIIAYNATEQIRITNLLTTANVSMTNVDFYLLQTNDVWVRDNGPIFVRDSAGSLHIEDWGFNGWGGDYNYNLCDPIPTSVGAAIGMPIVNLNTTMVAEGGSYELDGNGVLLATKSSLLTQTNSGGALAIRNPGMTQFQAETIFTQYVGATKFIWLDGFLSTDDVTDAHIDGFAKFADDSTLVTMNNSDLTYWGLSSTDIATLYAASDMNNVAYNIVYVPLTQNNVVTAYGNNLGYKGSYCNYYVANNVVLVPNYNDPNDAVANAIIQALYPGRTVVGIDCRNLYENGGMVHCVTQQQPSASPSIGIYDDSQGEIKVGQTFPNPFNQTTTINVSLPTNANVQIVIFNSLGQIVSQSVNSKYSAGNHSLTISADGLENGIYTYIVTIDNQNTFSRRMIIAK
ncbi:MAG: agmatine deiminase family protein [Bacteroidetes bacterium]|nr:agmatine deiminase family protein [Bacteroidota bacterium]